MESETKTKKGTNPRVKANLLSVLFFLYQFPMFIRNYKKGLTENDLYEPLDEHKAKKLGDRLEEIWEQQHRKHKKSALHRSFLKIFGLQFAVIGIFKFINEMVLIIVTPMCIGGLVSYFDSSSEVTKSDAYIYTGLLMLSLLSDLFISSHSDLAMTHMSMKLRVSCSSLIYRKSLRLSRSALGQTTIGQIVNLLTNDVGKFDEGFLSCHYVWIAPVQALVGTYLLYRIIGVTAFPGVGFLLLFIPLQMYFGKKTSELRLRTALRTDERVRLMNEILNGIQVIKMYSWEKPFAKLVAFARSYEIKSIRTSFFLEAVTFCLEMILTRIAVFITIIIFVYSGNNVNADTVYSVIATYDVLRPTMTIVFSYGISSISDVYVTMSRIQKFLSYEELTPSKLNGGTDICITKNTEKFYQSSRILLNNVSAQWNSDSSDQTLTDINMNIDKNKLIAVIGEVGSGKSSLFHVLLKELPITKGTMTIDGKISYASQEAWLFSASVRQNILFGDPYIEDRYKTVLKICALEPDIALFPHGDKTIVGEKGKVLSGGQKARINLARAIYKQADIYLLDDPLSAVDTKVGKHLFEECILKFLCDKICILITHQLQYLRSADTIIIIKEGTIVEQGTFEKLQSSGLDFAVLLRQFNSEEEKGQGEDNKIKLRQNSEINDEVEDDEVALSEETMQSGSISAKVYAAYFKFGGNYVTISLLLFLLIAAQSAGSAGDLYISEWVNFEQRITEGTENDTLNRNVIVYGYSAIIGVTIILAAFQSVFFFVFFMRASVNMHNSIFSVISYGTMRFFNLNPIGRVLNRFSKDIGTIDEYLPYILYDVLQLMLFFLGAVVVTSIVNPWLLLPALAILIAFYLFRNVYLKTSRSVKRIEGIARSPVFTHLTASMHGLTTIRAFSAQTKLVEEFDNHLDLHSSAWYLYLTSNKAFDFSLTFICSVVVSTVSVTLILLDKDYYGGEAGLILTQYISIASILEWAMRALSELENNMVSVERVLEYTKTETEPVRKQVSTIPRHWPEFGKIVFLNVSMKYNPQDEPVLKNLNFTIYPQEKVGVVGRTGAGKSSVISALFQLYDIEGSIFVDDVDTTKLPLEELRSKISIIPQEPVLFSGTLRRNLDPFDEYNDETLWNALEQVKLKEVVTETPSGLSSNVTEGGSNYSVGQRQLICLARAIVRNNRILVMDEATANVDPYTDSVIQETIRKEFANCTVITIAHRLHTIMDSDRVLVMDVGRIVEFAHSYTLLQNRDSKFYNMVQTAGTAVSRSLHSIAEESFRKRKTYPSGII